MIAIISDTHMPKGGRRLPDACRSGWRAPGRSCTQETCARSPVLDELRAIGPPVTAVYGNVDDAAVRMTLPAAATVVARSRGRSRSVHDAGAAAGRLARLRRRFPGSTRSSSAIRTSP